MSLYPHLSQPDQRRCSYKEDIFCPSFPCPHTPCHDTDWLGPLRRAPCKPGYQRKGMGSIQLTIWENSVVYSQRQTFGWRMGVLWTQSRAMSPTWGQTGSDCRGDKGVHCSTFGSMYERAGRGFEWSGVAAFWCYYWVQGEDQEGQVGGEDKGAGEGILVSGSAFEWVVSNSCRYFEWIKDENISCLSSLSFPCPWVSLCPPSKDFHLNSADTNAHLIWKRAKYIHKSHPQT